MVNGDDAGWIDEGAEQFLTTVHQLDGFHLSGLATRDGKEEELSTKLYEQEGEKMHNT